jgi:dimethylargininase
MFDHAIARRPGTNVGMGLTTADLGAPDVKLMLEQHDACLQTLASLGVAITVLDADPRFPDGCFVEDCAVVVPDCTVITRPGAPSRRGEVGGVEAALAAQSAHWKFERIVAPGCVDGGDVIVADGRALIGLSQRTNAEGARQLARILMAHGLTARTVRVEDGLHLKSDVSYLSHNVCLLTPRFADRRELADFDRIVVADEDAYSANCVCRGEHVLAPAGYPRTSAALERAGFTVHELDMSEFRKMDGGLSCLTLRF